MSDLALSTRRVAKNTISQVASFAIGTVAYAVAGMLVGQRLGPHGLGVFSPAWQLAIMMSVVALLGVDQLLIREMNRSPLHVIGPTLTLSVLTGAAVGLAVAVVPLLLGEPADVTRAFIAAGLYIAASGPTLVARAAFHARERMEVESLSMLAEGVVALVAMPVVLALGGGAAAVIGALVGGRLASCVLSLWMMRRMFGHALTPRLKGWRRIVRAGLPMGLAFTFAGFFLRFDVIVVGALRPLREAGIYAAAAVVASAIPMVVSAVARSLYPVLSRAEDRHDRDLRTVFGVAWSGLLAVGPALAVGVVVAASPALRLMYGPGFGGSARFLVVLACLLPIRFVNGHTAMTLSAAGWRRREEIVAGLIVLGNLAANIALVSRFGAWGAVYASVATDVTVAVLLIAALRRLHPPVLTPLGVAVAGLGAALVVGFLLPGPQLVRAAMCGLVAAASGLAASVLTLSASDARRAANRRAPRLGRGRRSRPTDGHPELAHDAGTPRGGRGSSGPSAR